MQKSYHDMITGEIKNEICQIWKSSLLLITISNWLSNGRTPKSDEKSLKEELGICRFDIERFLANTDFPQLFFPEDITSCGWIFKTIPGLRLQNDNDELNTIIIIL